MAHLMKISQNQSKVTEYQSARAGTLNAKRAQIPLLFLVSLLSFQAFFGALTLSCVSFSELEK